MSQIVLDGMKRWILRQHQEEKNGLNLSVLTELYDAMYGITSSKVGSSVTKWGIYNAYTELIDLRYLVVRNGKTFLNTESKTGGSSVG